MGLADRTPPTAEEYAAYRERFNNWGRWGPDDEFGTLNHITEEVRRGAATLVRSGRSLSLGRPIDTHAGPRNPYPAHHFMRAGSSGGLADYIGLFFHGFAQTHLDAFCHSTTPDRQTFFNGRPAVGPMVPKGKSSTVDFWRDGIITRGVLYDIPRLRGTAHVTPDAPVHGWDLEDAAKAQGVEPRPGDAVLIRCGYEPYFAAHPDTPGWGSPAGVHASAVEYLYRHDAALLCWDMLESPSQLREIPNPIPAAVPVHVHEILLPYMGMPILDNASFERLAAACAELGRWEFLFVVAPLIIEGGTGSPVNPLAVF
jgi:kynurenine formamidase